MHEICCIGHITLDKVVTPKAVTHMAGGTSFYFSHALSQMDVRYQLITALAATEMSTVAALRAKGIDITAIPSTHSVYFENIYPENPDHRTQRVLQKADAFSVAQLRAAEAGIFHLGPLLADDIPLEVIQYLSAKGKVSLDVQGYLREVRNENVYAIDWADKRKALPFIEILKANESEMEVLTGHSDVQTAARVLSDWGVKEVVITLGSLGSVIYVDGVFHEVKACRSPAGVVDTTGCGDTYMAGYLYQRSKGAGPAQAGAFASAMAGLKTGASGPFTGTEQEVRDFSLTFTQP